MSLHACGRHKMQICQFANVAPMVSAPLSGALKLIIALTFQNVKNESLELALEGPSDYIIN